MQIFKQRILRVCFYKLLHTLKAVFNKLHCKFKRIKPLRWAIAGRDKKKMEAMLNDLITTSK